MLEQLLPLLALAGIFGIYALKQLVVYLWEQSTLASAEELQAYLNQEQLEHD